MSEIKPADNDPPYKAQYSMTSEDKKWVKHLFHDKITDKQVQQFWDGYIKNMSDQMNHVLDNALKEQKKRDQEDKEANS